MPGVKTRPRSLVRLRVQHVRGGVGWEVKEEGILIKAYPSNDDWPVAMAQANKIASRWRSHYAAWLW